MTYTDQHDRQPYLCVVCQRPIHPSEGALCVVCRETRRAQRRARSCRACHGIAKPGETLCEACQAQAQREQEHADDLAGIGPLLAEHPMFYTVAHLVRAGVPRYSDWPDHSASHDVLATTADDTLIVPSCGWDAELDSILYHRRVLHDNYGRDSLGDQYAGGWWELPGEAA